MFLNLLMHFCWILPAAFCYYDAKKCQQDIESLYGDMYTTYISSPYEEFDSGLFVEGGLYGKNCDYIVIGAGASGSVMANRLSEDGHSNVLVLEAGSYPEKKVQLPGAAGLLQFNRKYNYNHTSVPQKRACLGSYQGCCPIPRGKGLGGSTQINYAIHARGNKMYYDELCCKYHDTDWCYDNVLQIYKNMENATMTTMVDAGYHGTDGPVPVEHSEYFNTGQVFLDATEQIGRHVCDYNGKKPDCSSRTQFTIKNGEKQTAYHNYLQKITGRPNLKVLTKAFVTKLQITGDKVTGVHFVANGTKYFATARKEYVLSAGSVGTPQILMLSGIGPREHLKTLNIPVKANLPVGYNLWDHLFNFVTYSSSCKEVPKTLLQLCKEYAKGGGPLTVPGNIQSLGFFHTNLLLKDIQQPNIELLTLLDFSIHDGFLAKLFSWPNSFATEVLKDLSDTTNFLIFALQTPESRGTIKLKSDNPFDAPLIDLNYYENQKDLDTVLDAIQLIKDLLKTPAMQKCNATLIIPDLSACNSFQKDSIEYLKCYLQHTTYSIFHLAGTCKMGPKCSKDTVVTPDCRVKNINKLRVADLSVLSEPVTGHTTAPGYLIGEICSQKIRADYPDLTCSNNK